MAMEVKLEVRKGARYAYPLKDNLSILGRRVFSTEGRGE